MLNVRLEEPWLGRVGCRRFLHSSDPPNLPGPSVDDAASRRGLPMYPFLASKAVSLAASDRSEVYQMRSFEAQKRG